MENKKLRKKISNKGQGQVIVTILLVLLAIVAISIIAGVVIPLVRNTTEETKCFDALGLLEIDVEYSCFDEVNKNVSVSVIRHAKDVEIEGFLLGIGGSENFRIINGSSVANINKGGILEIPDSNEQRTYELSLGIGVEVNHIKISPILKGGMMCAISDEADIEKC